MLDTNPITGEGDSLAERGLAGAEELYKRLTQLDDDELASVLKTSASDIASIYGPGFEEKAKKSQLTSLKTTLTSQTNDLLTQMELTGKADGQSVSNLLASMDDIIQKDPTVGQAFRNKRNELALVSTVAATVRTADIDDLNSVIKDIKDGTQNFGGAGLDTDAEQAAFKFLTNRLSAMTTALKNDALQWGIDNGLVEEPVPTLFNEDGNFDQNLIERRNINAHIVAEHYNLAEPQYLTKNEVDQFKRIIKKKDLNPNTKLAFVADFQKAWGGATPAVFTQMGEKDSYDMAALGSLVNAGRNDAALAIMKGMEEFDAGLKIPGEVTEADLYTVFTAFITDDEGMNIFSDMDPDDLDAIYTLAKAHYKGRGITEYDEDLFVLSLNTVVGAEGDRGGIREVREQKTLLPPEMTADEVENFMDNLSSEIVAAMNSFAGEDDSDMKLSEELINDIRQRNDDYVLKYFSSDEYYIFDKSRNGIVRFPNGDPFIVNLFQIQKEFPNAFTEEVRRSFFTGKIKE